MQWRLQNGNNVEFLCFSSCLFSRCLSLSFELFREIIWTGYRFFDEGIIYFYYVLQVCAGDFVTRCASVSDFLPSKYLLPNFFRISCIGKWLTGTGSVFLRLQFLRHRRDFNLLIQQHTRRLRVRRKKCIWLASDSWPKCCFVVWCEMWVSGTWGFNWHLDLHVILQG